MYIILLAAFFFFLNNRKVKSQGLPLACVLPAMVCCSALYFSLTHAKDLVHILTVYLVVLCVLSGVSIIATLLHFILYPNNIVFFNFAIIGVAFATQHWLKGTCMSMSMYMYMYMQHSM